MLLIYRKSKGAKATIYSDIYDVYTKGIIEGDSLLHFVKMA